MASACTCSTQPAKRLCVLAERVLGRCEPCCSHDDPCTATPPLPCNHAPPGLSTSPSRPAPPNSVQLGSERLALPRARALGTLRGDVCHRRTSCCREQRRNLNAANAQALLCGVRSSAWRRITCEVPCPTTHVVPAAAPVHARELQRQLTPPPSGAASVVACAAAKLNLVVSSHVERDVRRRPRRGHGGGAR